MSLSISKRVRTEWSADCGVAGGANDVGGVCGLLANAGLVAVNAPTNAARENTDEKKRLLFMASNLSCKVVLHYE